MDTTVANALSAINFGEELSGAKQNRVLNTSVLVPSKSKIHAPVSCTEHGRWRYQSRAFSESGYRMSRKMNAKKSESVSMNLKDSMCYESDQCMVWDEIDKFSREKGVHSNTGAMKDVHDREKPVIDKYLKSFPCVPGQHGVFVIVNGEIAGFDMLSRIEAYEKLHNKFIASYAIDADNSLETKREKYTLQEVMDFIKKISSCVESIYKSVGLGNDYRYESETVIGSALLYMDTGIHCSFFAKEESAHSNEERHNISGFSNRMHSRMRTNRH